MNDESIFRHPLKMKDSLNCETSGRIDSEEPMTTLHSEIFEQPERLASLLDHQKQTVIEIAKAIQSRNVQYAFLAARGTSDNAGAMQIIYGAHIMDCPWHWQHLPCSRTIKCHRV